MSNNDLETRRHRMQCEKCDHKFTGWGPLSCPKCKHDYVVNYTLEGKPTIEQIEDKKQTN